MVVLKIILLGETNVGKTSFVCKYLQRHVPQTHTATIGAAMTTKNICINGANVQLNIWDTAGQERFNSLTTLYYRGSDIAIIMYDITSFQSYERAQNYYNSLIENGPENIIIGLIGNKRDIVEKDSTKRVIPYSLADEWSKIRNIYFKETTAFHNKDVNDTLNSLIDLLPDSFFVQKYNEEDALLERIMEEQMIKSQECCNIS